MEQFTPISSLIGGVLIGLAATGMLLLNGRITGISGILSQAMFSSKERGWRVMFLLGLLISGIGYGYWSKASADFTIEASEGMLIAAGLLVGFGTRLGSGCTSGHGICGLARLSKRSLAATVVFMASAMATVWFIRHAGGVL